MNEIKNDYYEFFYNDSMYLFIPQIRTDIELNEINSIINNNEKIVRNIYNQLSTIINNKKYVLIRKMESNVIEVIKNAKYITLNCIFSINRTNWVELWSKKIDYIEYQLVHVSNKYRLITNSIWYYIGMTETAISYINNTFNENPHSVNKYITISHERIIKDSFNNPQNIIIDYKSRDISEYLKYIFINDCYDYNEIKLFLKDLKLNKFLYQLIYGRMFFPTFYFDVYDKIIDNSISEYKIKKIIVRSNDYEKYLKNIYNIINSFVNIKEIDWINLY